ncbi:hypothetical protein GF367_03610 [Candidatus Woesearchaeota archaeon]|nr:hypothetical protein [Candidatus Woesearchaeota archaeon]
MKHKGEMGIGTLIVFLALLLAVATAASVLMTTGGKLQEKSLTSGKQTQAQVSTNAKVVEVSGVDGSDGRLEHLATIYQLAAGSDPVRLEGMLITESTAESSASLRLREGGITEHDVFEGYFTASDTPRNYSTEAFESTVPPSFYSTFGPSQTSEMMIGKVAVAVIFPESNGAIDPNTENWTAAEQDEALEHAANSLNWWNNIEPKANIRHTFEVYRDIPTGYEPITKNTTDEELWINETLDNMGVTDTGDMFTRIRAFNHELRQRKNAHWAFTLFVVDSSNTPGGGFPDGYAGVAYINGPHTFIASAANAPWQSAVYTHEFGHIFGATDQYAGCACGDLGGYYSIETGNCVAGCTINETSLMRTGTEAIEAYNNDLIDVFALGQVGLIDENGNGLLDPVDHLFEGVGSGLDNALITGLATNGYSRSNSDVGFFTYEYLNRGQNSVDDRVKHGDIIRVYHEAGKYLEEGEEVWLRFIPKTGSTTQADFITPEVMSHQRVYLYPSK